ncbi:MAG TPA: heptaprenyl diphosphate synthase [Lachnospiraceae bacterium]|nr:heptaprenyl diphosphate synthase [Lachnospiraceae bacterium]
MDTKNIARIGMMVAVAFVLSYIESMLPLNFGVPGIKAGFSNIVVIFALFSFSPVTTFGIAVVRIILCGITFGSLSGMLYSLAGGILSFLVMLVLKKTQKFSIYGISVAGGVFHNIGQIFVAMAVLQSSLLLYYLPFLVLAGIIAGAVVGIIGAILVKRLRHTDI